MTVQISSCASIALMSKQAGQNTAWVHLIPAGTFSGVDGRGPWTLNKAEKVIAASREYLGKRQMVVDYEHQSINSQTNGQPAPAAGWIVGLEARPDGIWGLVEWTEAAAAHIAKREYRYISPVFAHTKAGEVLAVRNASLTNSPNLDQLVALNRAESTMENEQADSKLKATARLLGLGEDASQETVVTKLRELLTVAGDLADLTGVTELAANSAIPDPAKYVPIGDFERVVKEANSLRQGVTETAANSRIAEDIKLGRLAPFMKDWAVSLCKTNMPAYEGFMQRVGPAFTGMMKNRHASMVAPNMDGKPQLSDADIAVCSSLGLTAEEYAKAR